METVDQLVKMAMRSHSHFAGLPAAAVQKFFEDHRETTIIRRTQEGDINGFCVWEERGNDEIEVLALAGKGSTSQNLRSLLSGRELLPPGKKMTWYDPKQKRKRTLRKWALQF